MLGQEPGSGNAVPVGEDDVVGLGSFDGPIPNCSCAEAFIGVPDVFDGERCCRLECFDDRSGFIPGTVVGDEQFIRRTLLTQITCQHCFQGSGPVVGGDDDSKSGHGISEFFLFFPVENHQLQVPIVGAFRVGYRQHETFFPVQKTGPQKVGADKGPRAVTDGLAQAGLLLFFRHHFRTRGRIGIHRIQNLLQREQRFVNDGFLEFAYFCPARQSAHGPGRR